MTLALKMQCSHMFFFRIPMNSSSFITYLFHQPVSKATFPFIWKKKPLNCKSSSENLASHWSLWRLGKSVKAQRDSRVHLVSSSAQTNPCFMGEVILQKANENLEIYSIYRSCVNVLCEFLVYSDNSNTVRLTRFCRMILPCEAGEPWANEANTILPSNEDLAG